MVAVDVLCLGEMLWDCLADQPTASIAAVQSWSRYAGGAPANVAAALVKLGTAAGFIGCMGTDSAGEELRSLLLRTGVQPIGLQQSSAPTRQVQVLRNERGDRQFAGFVGSPDPEAIPAGSIVSPPFADENLQADQLPIAAFSDAQFLVMGTLGLASPVTAQAMQRALQLAQETQTQVVIDVNWRPMFWQPPHWGQPAEAKPLILDWMRQAQLVKLAIEEAEWLLDATEPGTIVDRLRPADPDRFLGVWVTAGDRGCGYWINGHVGQIPAFQVPTVDTTGAGDGFLAGCLHVLCRRGTSAIADAASIQQMVQYGSAVGALTTLKPGAIDAQPTALAVEQFLHHYNLPAR